MLNKKNGILILTIMLIYMLFTNKLLAEDNKNIGSFNSNDTFISIKPEFDQMFDFNNSKTVSLRATKNKMFIEFKSQKDALQKIKNRCSELIRKIKDTYALEELSETNWEDYYGCLQSIIDDTKGVLDISEGDYEYRFLQAFFDIYENKFKNNKVENLSQIVRSKNVPDNDEREQINETIAENLPYDSAFAREYFEKHSLDLLLNRQLSFKINNDISNQTLRSADIDLERAVSYASQYAENPNEPDYYYFSHGDCANFVSQILEYSGVRQEIYDSEYSGWWHKYNPDAWFFKHKHSRSWTKADVFARYMGVVFTDTNHKKFSENVFRGSFIAYDKENDGDWNHMAFVTATDNYIGSYGYYDYKVAQHTSNYHKWTSNTDNHWEDIGKDGGKYGRVRY